MPRGDDLLPPSPRREAFGLLLALLACGATFSWALVADPVQSGSSGGVDGIPGRFTDVVFEPETPETPEAMGIAHLQASPPLGETPALESRPEEETGQVSSPAKRSKERASELRAKKDLLSRKSRLLTGIIGTRGANNNGERVTDVFANGDAGIKDLEEALEGVGGIEVSVARGMRHRGAADGGRANAGIGDLAITDSIREGEQVRHEEERRRASSAVQSSEPVVDFGQEHLTERDSLSTFAVDVDTASYTQARQSLRDGRLPAPRTVRVEEFVNYLDYDYIGPTGEAPFAVHMEAGAHPWSAGRHIMRVGVQGKRVAPQDRRPLRLTFLVDVSGSMMRDDRIGLVRESLAWLTHRLGPEDSVAIVTYAGRTEVLLEPTPTTSPRRILSSIAGLRTGGGTAMGSGVELAYELAQASFVPGAENRVVVLSDGNANIGSTSHDQILRLIDHHAGQGITMTTLGFGSSGYRDDLMEQLANQGDGNYHFIDSLDEAQRVLGDRLDGTLNTIARDVKIQVDFDAEAVRAWRLLGYENRAIADREFRQDAVDAGEIGSGHQVTALYEVVLRDGFLEAPSRTLATVRLRAKPPGVDAPAREWQTRFPARLVTPEFPDTSADLRMAFGAATFAEKLRHSPFVEEVDFGALARLVDDARRPDEPEDDELYQLVRIAGRLSTSRGGG